jgi:hypothetical protein
LHELVERRLQLFAPLGQIGFFPVPECRHSRGLLYNEQMLIDIGESHIRGRDRGGGRPVKYFDHIAGLKPPLLVEAQVAMDLHATAGDEPTNLRPGRALQKILEGGGQGLAGELWGNVECPG